jgi:hypothetical protein
MRVISLNFANFFCSGKHFRDCSVTFLGKEGEIQVLAGKAPSSKTVRSLLRTFQAGQKNTAKSSAKSLQWKNNVDCI